MASARDIRLRIRSVQSIFKITNAMEMIAASRLRRAQERAATSFPYGVTVVRTISSMIASCNDIVDHPFLAKRTPERVAFVVLSSDKGLAGAYNSNLFKEVLKHIATAEEELAKFNAPEARMTKFGGRRIKRSAGTTQRADRKIAGGEFLDDAIAKLSEKSRSAEVCLFTVGKKATQYFKKRNYNVLREYTGFSERPTFSDASRIARDVIEGYLAELYDEVYVVATRFHSPVRTNPLTIQVLPVEIRNDVGDVEHNMIFTPDSQSVFEYLMPRYVEVLLFTALTQSSASELGSRMTAMGAATDNAKELITELVLNYNKVRQAAITNELAEIVSGAEALK
ncbi:MAG: FoF1 ATP synthase subunit gamma [Bacillota bacterium]